MGLQFLVAAQWQGSGSTRALHLSDGANAIMGDLPATSTRVIDIPLGAGESLGSGVSRLSAIQTVRDRIADALTRLSGTVVTIGGDCGVELSPVSHAHSRHPGDLALIWIDAHPDANSPETSPSGAFHGMVTRSMMGEGFASLALDNPLPSTHIIFAGTRALDEGEAQWISDQGIRMLPPAELNAESLVTAIRATGASAVYLHVDLDVLDPAEFTSLDYPEPFGVSLATLVETIKAVVSEFNLAGAGICEFAPATPTAAADDLPSILRIIGALTV
ncbi:MAG: arginase family protein [Terrimesophilobacter sp.]